MPKKWENHWSRLHNNEERDIRNNKLLTLGNLAIITQPLNGSIRDRNWSTKKKGLIHYSSGLETLAPYLELDEWNENEIDKRAMNLYNYAINIWKDNKNNFNESIKSQNDSLQTLNPVQAPSVKKQSLNKHITVTQNSKIESETLETINSGIITFRKYSASDIFVRLVSLYGFDKNQIIIGMNEAKKRNKFTADPEKKWLKMYPLVKKLLEKGRRLPVVNSLEDAIEYLGQ